MKTLFRLSKETGETLKKFNFHIKIAFACRKPRVERERKVKLHWKISNMLFTNGKQRDA